MDPPDSVMPSCAHYPARGESMVPRLPDQLLPPPEIVHR